MLISIMLNQIYSLGILSIPLILIEMVCLYIYFMMIYDSLYTRFFIKKYEESDKKELRKLTIFVGFIFSLSCIFPIIIPINIILFLINICKSKNIKHDILYNKPLYGQSIFDEDNFLIKIIKTMDNIEKEGLLTIDELKVYCNKYHIFEYIYRTEAEKYLYLVLGISYDYGVTIAEKEKILKGVDKYTDIKDKILNNEDCSMYSSLMVIDYITEYLLKDSSIDYNILDKYVRKYYIDEYYEKFEKKQKSF